MRLEYFDGGQWVVVSTDIASVPVSSKFDFLNGNFKGFRIGHLTNPTDTLGTFHLSVLNYISSGENSHYESTRIFTFNNNNNDSFEFLKPVNLSSNFVIAADFSLYNFRIINLGEPILSTDAATKGYIDAKVNPALYTLDQFSPPVTNLNLNSKKIINVAEPVDFSDGASKGYVDIQTVNTKDYVDSHTWTASQITDFNTQVKANHINDLAAPTGNVNMNMYNVTNLASPVENKDAVNKEYIDSHTWVASNITDLDTYVKTIPLNQFTDPIGDLDINGYKVLNVNLPTLNGDATNKIYVDNSIAEVKSYVDNHDWLSGDITGLDSYIKAISLDQFAIPIADINLNSHKITNVATPVANTDATNKAYVDNHTWTASQVTDLDTHVKAIPLNDFADPLSALDANGFKILNVDLPTLNGDAANKIYVDNHTWSASQVTDLDTHVKTIPLNQFTTPSADVSLNSHKITSLAEPTLSTDAATKNYVDSHAINPTSYSLDQFAVPVANISMNGKRLYSLPTPTSLTDATNKSYVDTLVDTTKTDIETWVDGRNIDVSKVAGLDSHVKAIPLNEFAVPTFDLNLNQKSIQGLATPVFGTDATNKNYVDGYIPKYNQVFPVLPNATSVTWDISTGNTATLDIWPSGAIPTPSVTLDIVGTSNYSQFTLFVKQTMVRPLLLGDGILANGMKQVPLSTIPDAVDILRFQRDGQGNIYLVDVLKGFQAPVYKKYIFDYVGYNQFLVIPSSPLSRCRIKVLGASGGGSLNPGYFDSPNNLANNFLRSGAGGFSIYEFNTAQFIGHTLNIIVGGGGSGVDVAPNLPGLGGWPAGGHGASSGYGASGLFFGGGGGRSQVDLVNTGQLIFAGGGGAMPTTVHNYNSSTTLFGGAGGGLEGQNSSSNGATGGTQTAGGIGAADGGQYFGGGGARSYPYRNAVSTEGGAGGGSGWFGGGSPTINSQTGGGGGSGWLNTTFSECLYAETYTGNYGDIPEIAANDPDFAGNFGRGVGVKRQIRNTTLIGNSYHGNNGRVVIEFY